MRQLRDDAAFWVVVILALAVGINQTWELVLKFTGDTKLERIEEELEYRASVDDIHRIVLKELWTKSK